MASTEDWTGREDSTHHGPDTEPRGGEVIPAPESAMPRDLALIKMENESIMMAARSAGKRNYVAIKQDIMDQLAAFPSFAKTAMYDKPVGRDGGGQMRFATGLSIRAAEAIASAYGFNRVRADVLVVDDSTVKIEASFTDYVSGRVWSDSVLVSKNYRAAGGGTKRHSDDRFNNVVVKAEKSKVIREVILRSVPPGLRSELEESVDIALANALDEHTVKRIITQFSGKAVTQEMLERLMEKKVESFNQEDRKRLLGVWNSINDGEATVAEVFEGGNGTAAPATPSATAQTVVEAVKKRAPRKKTEKKVEDKETSGPPTSTPTSTPTSGSPASTNESYGMVTVTVEPDRPSSPDAPSEFDQIVISLAERDNASVPKARERMEVFVTTLMRKTVGELTSVDLASLRSHVKTGDLKIG